MGPKASVPGDAFAEKPEDRNDKNNEDSDFVVVGFRIVCTAVIRAAGAAKKRWFEGHAQQFTDRFSAVE